MNRKDPAFGKKELLLALFVPINNETACCPIRIKTDSLLKKKNPENIKSWTVLRVLTDISRHYDPKGEVCLGFHSISEKILLWKTCYTWAKSFSSSNSNYYLLKALGLRNSSG